ncbi:MAG: tetratricopeptide repeat protein [Alistipes sp.]
MKRTATYILAFCAIILGSFTTTAQEQEATVESPATPIEAQTAEQEREVCRQAWKDGNRAYMDGDFKKAAEHYQSILGYGLYSAKLYYNLGNVAFKLGNTGEAILYYNKALKLAPSDEDIRHNLAIAEAQTKDKITVMPEFFVKRWVREMRNSLSCTAWSIWSLAAFALVLACVALFMLAERLALRKTGFYGAIVSALLLVVTAWCGIAERRDMLQRTEAIVMASAISVKSSPDRSATDLFVLHEGTKVRIATELENWSEIVIADGKKGWVDAGCIEQI